MLGFNPCKGVYTSYHFIAYHMSSSPINQFGVNLGVGTSKRTHVPTHDAPKSKKCKKKHASGTNLRWTTTQLNIALNVVDAETKIMFAAQEFGIPCSTLQNHLFGTTMSRKRGKT